MALTPVPGSLFFTLSDINARLRLGSVQGGLVLTQPKTKRIEMKENLIEICILNADPSVVLLRKVSGAGYTTCK